MQYSGQDYQASPKRAALRRDDAARVWLRTGYQIYLVGVVGAGLWAGAGWVLTGWDLSP